MKSILRPLFIFAFGMLAACSGVQGRQASIWIEVPVQELIIPLGGEVHIEGHAVNTGDIEGVELWANEEMLDTIDVLDQGSLVHYEHFWTPAAAGEYLITAIALTGDESQIREDSVTVYITDEEEVLIEPVEVEEAPDEEVCLPILTATKNAKCRFGPDMVFEELGYLLQDESSPIDGRLEDNSWWLIPNPDHAGQCWIADSVVETDCASAVPIAAAPPTPIPPPEDTTPPPIPSPAYPIGGQVVACMGEVTLAWNPVSDESGIAGHVVQFERSPDTVNYSPESGSPFHTGDGIKHSVVIDCGGYYRWRVRAEDGEGNRSDYSGWAYFEVTLP